MQEYVLKSKDFLVSQTDEKGIILFANNIFCSASGYTIQELVGQPHNIIRHPDMPSAAFKDLWETVQGGDIWRGYVKNITKDGGFYWVYAVVYPMYDEVTKTKTYISCRKKPSQEEISKAEKLYATLK